MDRWWWERRRGQQRDGGRWRSDEQQCRAGGRGVRVHAKRGRLEPQAYLKASNTGGADRFGRSVAVSGDTVVVGAEGEDSSATGVDGDQTNNFASASGAAYVFTIGSTDLAPPVIGCAADDGSGTRPT